MKNYIFLSLVTLLFSSLVFSQSCPEGTWPRSQYTGPDGGLYTGPGGGLYTGPGLYCSNRPPLSVLVRMGIIDSNYRLR